MYLGILSKPQFEGDKNVDVTVIELSEYMKKNKEWDRRGKKAQIQTGIWMHSLHSEGAISVWTVLELGEEGNQLFLLVLVKDESTIFCARQEQMSPNLDSP